MAEIHGNVASGFEALEEVLSASIDSGDDIGASVAVTVRGEIVADIWGGWADEAKTKPWNADTITNVWSTTKTMTSLSALVLADRGQLDFDAPVASYWPEFAAKGKQDIPVRSIMGHTSGVSGWSQPVELEDLYDWDKSTSMLAAQEPWWEPGTASGYHALNQGHLVGEVIRRITGRTLGQYFASEIAEPLGVDFHIGLDPSNDDRVSNVIPPPPLPYDLESMEADNPAVLTLTGPPPAAEASWTTEWRRAEIGAANGHGNARSVARALAVIANGGEVDGTRLLSLATIAKIFEVQADGVDLVTGVPLKFGIGFGLGSELLPMLPQENLCFWGGWGGSLAIIDTEKQTTFSYVMNRMEQGVVGDERGWRLYDAYTNAIQA